MKKYSILIAMVLVLALSVTTFAGSFADVPSNHWAYEGVNKLVAAGLIQGYPDGTFKGQNDLTRYEIAVMLARLLEDIEEARAELVDQVDFMVNDALIEADSGLSPEEAEDVQAIVEAVIEKNDDGSDEPAEAPVQDELSSGQAGEVMTLIGNLAAEFAPELETLGVEVADLQERVDDLEVVTFSGEYKVDFTNNSIDYAFNEEDEAYDAYENPFVTNDDNKITTEDNTFEHTLDVNVDVAKGPLDASLDLVLSKDGFGFDDSDGFGLESLEGVLEGPDFTATIKEGIEKGFKPYLFDGEYDDDDEWTRAVDGISLEVGDNSFLLHGETVNVEPDEEEEFEEFDYQRYAFGGHNTVDALGGFNLYYGLTNIFESEIFEDVIMYPTLNGIETPAVVGFDKTFDVGEFDVTPDLAFGNDGDLEGYYFTLNAKGELDLVTITFNAKSIEEEFVPIMAEVDYKKGFDLKGEWTALDNIDMALKFESYNTTELAVDYADGAEVPKTEFTAETVDPYDVAGFDVTGDFAYKTYNDIDDATSQTFNIGAKRETDDYTVEAKLEQENTDSAYLVAEEEDETDKIEKLDFILDADYTAIENITAGAHYKYDLEANELVEHVYDAEYAKDIVVAGMEADIEAEETKLYLKLNADKEESYSYFATDYTPYAEFTTWLDAELTNILIGVEADKDLSEYAALNYGMEYADYEKDTTGDDDGFEGPGDYDKYWIGASYDITDDIEATASFKHIDFDGDDGVSWEADLMSAGVSVAF